MVKSITELISSKKVKYSLTFIVSVAIAGFLAISLVPVEYGGLATVSANWCVPLDEDNIIANVGIGTEDNFNDLAYWEFESGNPTAEYELSANDVIDSAKVICFFDVADVADPENPEDCINVTLTITKEGGAPEVFYTETLAPIVLFGKAMCTFEFEDMDYSLAINSNYEIYVSMKLLL